jgi:hypothetical protein
VLRLAEAIRWILQAYDFKLRLAMETATQQSPLAGVAAYPLIEALKLRRSRRFGLGMEIPAGPLAHKSRFQPRPLSESEEAALAFAACGITGFALADLCYAPGHGGNIMAGLVGRTVASGDGIQTAALIVINDRATYFLKRPQDFSPPELNELIALGQRNAFPEIYSRTRVQIKPGRVRLSTDPILNINANRWSANAAGSSYFLPVQDLSVMYINGLLEIFNESTGVFVLDERADFQPAGLRRFARSRGGHLQDDPAKGCVATIRQVETMVSEFTSVEAGMMLQNLGLMSQALGLGGFSNFANHEYGWLQALGFRMIEMPASRYLGAGVIARTAMKLLRRDLPVPYAIGLERENQVLLKAYSPPYFSSMREAVQAVVEMKFSRQAFDSKNANTFWKSPQQTLGEVPRLTTSAIEATVAYCEYVWQRYGRFPAHFPAFRTVVGFQAAHLDVEFYDRFYRHEALSETQRHDFAQFAH